MASSQSSYSSSSSEPVVVSTPENAILNQLSGVAAGLAQQMLGWAQTQFAKTSQVTDQVVGNFMQVSKQMQGLSDNLTNQYNNIFAPQNASLAREADSYNSEARRRLNMGEAGATAAMAGENALRSAEANLRSYGIDPSSGRYAALDKAAAVQNSANIAGEMNRQRNADVATGQRLRSEAVQVGAQLPAAIANVNNTMIQANTGASNASLANANTGANLMRLPNDYLGTAMRIPLSPVAQKSQSSGGSSGFSSDGGGGRGGGGGGSSGGGGQGYAGPGGGSGSSWQRPDNRSAQGDFSGSGGGGGSRIRPGTMAGIRNVRDPDPYNVDDQYGWQNPETGADFSYLNDYGNQGFDGYNYYDGYNMNVGDPGANESVPYIGNDWYDNPFQDSGFGQEYNYGDPYQSYSGDQSWANSNWGNIDYNTGANSYDPGWENRYDQPNPDTDWGNGADAYQSYGYDYGANSGYSYSQPDFGDYGSSDYGGGNGYSTTSWDNYDYGSYQPNESSGSSFSDYDYYAEGGRVPESMSPSGGAQVDDIEAVSPNGPARLNANEFVVPEDVVRWKGEEYFQKLINSSRAMRTGAPAKPTQKQVA